MHASWRDGDAWPLPAHRGAMPSMVLSGLLFVTLQQQSAAQPQAPSSKKQEKKMQQQMKVAGSSSAKMAWGYISPALLERLEMSDEFDMLVRCFSIFLFRLCMQQRVQQRSCQVTWQQGPAAHAVQQSALNVTSCSPQICQLVPATYYTIG